MTILQNNEITIAPIRAALGGGKDDESGKFISLPNGDEQEL